MKNIVLSADGDRMVYSVPDAVASQLEDYCMEFCCHWLPDSPHRWIFPKEPSVLVENLGWIEFDQTLPEPYQDCPQFNF